MHIEWQRLCAYVTLRPAAAAAPSSAELQLRPLRRLYYAPAAPVRRQLLFGVSGEVQPGVMTAVLGPSGCGKTTLLSLLCRRSSVEATGTILVNGVRGVPKAHSVRMGFVTQDDLMCASRPIGNYFVRRSAVRGGCPPPPPASSFFWRAEFFSPPSPPPRRKLLQGV